MGIVRSIVGAFNAQDAATSCIDRDLHLLMGRIERAQRISRSLPLREAPWLKPVRAHDGEHAVGAPRPNVAPAAKPIADTSGSKSGGAAVQPRPKVMAQTSVPSRLPKNVEVLGNRVRCDVRYQELKLPQSEYRAFFNRCMGTPAKAGLSNATEQAVKAKEEPVTSPALQNAMKELSYATEHALKM